MSETSSAASFRWDDMRCAALHALRSYLRSILPHKQWNQEFEVQLLANVRLGVGLGRRAMSGRCPVYPKVEMAGRFASAPPSLDRALRAWSHTDCPLQPTSAANGCSYLAKSLLL